MQPGFYAEPMRRLVTISSVYANKRGKRRVKNPLLRTRLLFYRNTVKMEKSVFSVRKYREENEDNRKRRREKKLPLKYSKNSAKRCLTWADLKKRTAP